MLLSNLNLLATAPGGVARLRELILTLAVQGKLVPQDPADEPASVLLQKIRAEKDRWIAEGKIRKDKPLADISEEEKPFALPHGWSWARVGELGMVVGGGTPRSDEPTYWAIKGIPWLTPADLYGMREMTIAVGRRDISEEGLASSSAKVLPAGTVLFSSRAPIGYVAIAQNPLATNQGFKSCVPYLSGLSYYLYWHLKQLARKIDSEASGTTFKEISGKDFGNIVLSLPPLAEQSRIVTRVEELMRLCDALQAKGQLEATQHAQLLSTLLGTLTASATPEELADNWQRVAQHFDLLLDRPQAIDALEQTLLQLAVRGLLVPQDPADEPANVLLQKIRAEKDRLIAAGQIKRDKPLPPITDEEKPFELPVGWEWVRLGDIGYTNIGLTYSPSDVYETGTPVLRSNNVQLGKLDLSDLKRVNMKVKASVLVAEGDLLICARNGSKALVGKTALISGLSEPMAFGAFMAIFRSEVNGYVLHFINSPLFRRMITDVNTTTINQITQENLRSTVIPLPPHAEQSRINTRIEALMRLCADLRQRLAEREAVQARLAEALVQQVA